MCRLISRKVFKRMPAFWPIMTMHFSFSICIFPSNNTRILNYVQVYLSQRINPSVSLFFRIRLFALHKQPVQYILNSTGFSIVNMIVTFLWSAKEEQNDKWHLKDTNHLFCLVKMVKLFASLFKLSLIYLPQSDILVPGSVMKPKAENLCFNKAAFRKHHEQITCKYDIAKTRWNVTWICGILGQRPKISDYTTNWSQKISIGTLLWHIFPVSS